MSSFNWDRNRWRKGLLTLGQKRRRGFGIGEQGEQLISLSMINIKF